MAVIAAKASQDYENLKDTFNAQISSNNNVLARIAAVLRERQDTENALAVRLEAQNTQMEDNKENGETAIARVQNTQRIEMEDNKKESENDLRKQRVELASTKREMKANKKHWQQHLQISRNSSKRNSMMLQRNPDTPSDLWRKQLQVMINLRTQRGTQINLRMKPLWKHQVVLSGFIVERAGNRKSSRIEMWTIFACHPVHHHAVRLEVGEKAPPAVEEEERAEGAMIIWLVTQMSHRFPRFPLAMTHMTVQVRQIPVTTPEGVVYDDYHRYHQEVVQYSVALYEDAALSELPIGTRAKWSFQQCSKEIQQMTPIHTESGST